MFVFICIYLGNRYKYTTNYKYTFKCTNNKNALTWPVNCKKTNRHHAHISLRAKLRKHNDAKPRK